MLEGILMPQPHLGDTMVILSLISITFIMPIIGISIICFAFGAVGRDLICWALSYGINKEDHYVKYSTSNR